MSISGIIIAVCVIGGLGLIVSVFLCFFGNYFKVEVDEREIAVINVLPGNNCGGCGYPGCSGLAAAIVKGEAPVNGCPVGGEPVAKEVAKIMGDDCVNIEKMVAFVKCAGNCENTEKKYEYSGPSDCKMASFVPGGGNKSCDFGCLGYGSCKAVCQFDAIEIVGGIARINKEKCKACGKCIEACPKHLIELVPYKAKVIVNCSNYDRGPLVTKSCKVGCVGCGLCAKECPKEAITIKDNLAVIDQDKCVGCGLCAKKCPRKIIDMV